MNPFFQKLKIGKSSLLASFLVIVTIFIGFFWFRNNFLIQKDPFLDFIPVDTVLYWHLSSDNLALKKWFFDKTEDIFNKESSEKLNFLSNNIDSSNISLAIFPSLQDFVYYAELNQDKIKEIEGRISEKGLFLLDFDGRVAITNNKVILNEIKNIKNKEMPSFFSNFSLKMAMNKAGEKSFGQIFIKNNFKIGNLPLFFGKSNIADKNLFVTYPQKEGKNKDYDYLSVLEGGYLADDIENNIKNTLSYVFPEVRVKKLPDGTKVKELIADSSIFSFESSENDTKFLAIKPINRNIWLKKIGGKIILSTNKERIEDFLAEKSQKTSPYGKNMFDFYLWVVKKMNFIFDGVVFEMN